MAEPGFLAGSDSKEFACDAGDPGLSPGLGRSSGEGNGYLLQYSCLENPHGQRILVGFYSWRVVGGVAKCQTRLKAIFTSLHSSDRAQPHRLIKLRSHVSSINDYDHFPSFYEENVSFYNKALISLFKK